MEKFNSKMLKHLEDGGMLEDQNGDKHNLDDFMADEMYVADSKFKIVESKKVVYRRLYKDSGFPRHFTSDYYSSIDELNVGIDSDKCTYLGPIEELELPANEKRGVK